MIFNGMVVTSLDKKIKGQVLAYDYEKMSDVEFIDEAQNYWEDHFDEVVEEIEEYADCDFKKDRRDDIFIDINNTGGKY